MNKITELPVVYKNEGMQIVGMLHKPNTNKKPPAAVFFHGCTTTKIEAHWIFVKLARVLAQRGIMVLRFDFRYSGDSEGNFEDMTLSGEFSDALKSIDFLISECNADPARIGVLGLSMGGAIGAIVAGYLGNRIKSCILLNPVGMPLEDLHAIASSNNINVSSFPIEWNSLLFGRNFFDDLKNINPLEEITKATCPVLVINGNNDQSVPPARSKEYVEVVNNNGGTAELFIVEGADHVFNSVTWEKTVIEKVNDWCIENLI